MPGRQPVKTVALVTPPYHCGVVESAGTWLPLALVYVAGSLQEAGYDVTLYDAMSLFHEHSEIQATLEKLKPDVVGSSAITATYLDAVEVLRTAKRLNPDVITLLGGVHPNFMWRETLQEYGDVVDFIVRGEGELTSVELLQALEAGDDPDKVKGIAYIRDGRPVATPPRPFLENLDKLPLGWNLIDWSIYSYRPKPDSILGVVSSSRGCDQGCTFCSQQRFWERSWRARSPENFVDELEHLSRTYGVNIVMLADETPTIDEERWRSLLDELIRRNLDMEILMETRVDDILRDREILHLYKEAGIVHIYVGVESPHQKQVDIFEKNVLVEDSRLAIELINAAGIVSETSFVLGMPDETVDSIRRTVEMAIHYNPDMAFFLAIAPWPYSQIYQKLEPYIAVHDYRQYNLVKPVVKPIEMELETLEAELDAAHRRFYMSKMHRFHSMPAHKRDFMVSVMDLLVEHSYLGEKMRAMADHTDEMPEEMKKIFERMRAATTA